MSELLELIPFVLMGGGIGLMAATALTQAWELDSLRDTNKIQHEFLERSWTREEETQSYLTKIALRESFTKGRKLQ